VRALTAALLAAAFARPAHADPYKSLARDLLRDSGKLGAKTAAVVPFAFADGRESAGGAAVAESLQTELVAQGGLNLVERARLGKLLDEAKLQASGLVAPETAIKVGRMAGADLLVTGTLTDLGGGWVEVNARLVRVEDGRVLRAAKAKARKAWSESAPGPALSTPAPPEPASMKAAVVAPASGDGARKVAGRNIALRYAEPGRRPSVRVTDYTDPARPQWTEVPIRYLPRENRYEEFSADFSLAGRRYRLWTDLSSNLHLAPRSLLGGVWEKDRVVFPMQEVFEAWVSDIEKRSQLLEETPKSRIIAYYEPLERTDLRVSLFRVERSSGVEHLDYEPIEVEVLPGRGNEPSVGRLLEADGHYFRFHYSANPREVAAEEVR
jgi:hypothetical protein